MTAEPRRSLSHYDPELRVIVTDASNLQHATMKDIDALFDELVRLAKSLPSKVYVLAHWKNAGFFDSSVADHYGNRTADLLKHVRGVVRYAANDPITRAMVRSQMMKHLAEGTRSNFFETREEALDAVRVLERQSPH
jgi:hypothetical protein